MAVEVALVSKASGKDDTILYKMPWNEYLFLAKTHSEIIKMQNKKTQNDEKTSADIFNHFSGSNT